MSKINSIAWILQCILPLFTKKRRIATTYGSSKVYKYYKFLKKTEKFTKSELIKLQEHKMKNLLIHAYNNVPYYHDLLNKNKLKPKDFQSLSDLQKIPILTKEIIQNKSEQLIINAKNRKHYKYQTAQTGGSTGKPLTFHRDLNDNYISWAAYLRAMQWIDYNWGDRTYKLWGAPVINESTKKSIGKKIEENIIKNVRNEIIIDAFKLNDSDLKQFTNQLLCDKNYYIRGYVNAINQFADYLKNKNILLKPKGVITTAEMLLPTIKKNIIESFSCDVFDNYGCGETLSLAYECKQHNGLHVNDEHVILEFVKDLTNPMSSEKGEIVITNLDNFYMPFIRYANGDTGSKQISSCTCGLAHSKIASIQGRTSDLIKGLNGNMVHGEFFTHLLEETGFAQKYGIKDFEVVQETITILQWKIVANTRMGYEEIMLINNKVKEYLGNMENKFEYVNNIALTKSGKRRFTRTLL